MKGATNLANAMCLIWSGTSSIAESRSSCPGFPTYSGIEFTACANRASGRHSKAPVTHRFLRRGIFEE